MTKALIGRAHATGSDDLLGYAYGWLSHITADVVGHPYVNVAVGGPYRSHWQRHFVQEKFMDTWVWGFYHTPGVGIPAGLPLTGLPWDYASFTNVNSSSLHTRIDLGSDLPNDLSNLIVKALEDTYLKVPHPNVKGTISFLGPDEINRAYQMLYTAFEMITGKDRYIPRPKAPSVFNDDAPPTFPLPGGGSGGSGGSGGGSFSLSKLLEAIWDYVRDMLEYAAELALWLVSQVTTPLTYPVRYALYLLQLALYEAYRHFRWGLAISGWIFPEPDELANAMAQQFINPSASKFDDVLTRPLQENPPEQDKCAFFPNSPLEPNAWAAGPYCRHPMNYPYWFIELEPTDLQFEQGATNAATPNGTKDFVNSRLRSIGTRAYTGSLGNAIDFYMRRAAEIDADGGDSGKLVLPDWNLDGDRGYAAKCWKLTVPPSTPPNDLVPPNPSGVELTHL
ncbi:MAG TPA: zinc dependent phospholipase C family protein [Gemmatimonadaceae bacterium]|nr:zinc dependent phospholipase C family protein [Gemmatimonadaceae bacterium]